MAKRILNRSKKIKIIENPKELDFNTTVSKKLGNLFWGGFSKLCLGKKLTPLYFASIGLGIFYVVFIFIH